MDSIDKMNTEEFAEWVYKTSDEKLCSILEKKGYCYGKAMRDWLLFNYYDTPFKKLEDCLLLVEMKKIIDLEIGFMKIEDFSNQELIEFYKDLITEEKIGKDERVDNALKQIESKVDELDKNIMINSIMDYCHKLNITEEGIIDLLLNNNFNAYDIMIELKRKNNDLYEDDYFDLINGRFFYYPNNHIEKANDENFLIGDLKGKVVLPREDAIYLIDDYFDDYNLSKRVYKELLNIEMNKEDIKYKEFGKLKYN